MSKKIIIGNWKMNPESSKVAKSIFGKISKNLSATRAEVVICPPVLYLGGLKNLSKKIKLGVQNIFYESSGAHTGEIGSEMAYDLGARFVILGHSERRAMGEDNVLISKKVKAALGASIVPILCVGEKERDENHEYLGFVKNQLTEGLALVSKGIASGIIIAYEPVWAIGKNAIREATSEEFREMKVFIKKILNDKFGAEVAGKIKIIYGGSVNPKNAEEFMTTGEADGFLVGRDSLNPEKFLKIINLCNQLKN